MNLIWSEKMVDAFNILHKLQQTRKILREKATAAGLGTAFARDCELDLILFSEKSDRSCIVYDLTCVLGTNGGLKIPLKGLFKEQEGAELNQLDPQAYSDALVALASRLIANSARYEQRKIEIVQAFGEIADAAAAAGKELRLAGVTERAVNTLHPNEEDAIYFDVRFVVGSEDGKLATFCIDVDDAQAVRAHLEYTVLPDLGMEVPAELSIE
jgi:hypothetical protein